MLAGVGTNRNDSGLTMEVSFTSHIDEAGKWTWLSRGIMLFDTSSIPNDAAIFSAILSLYGLAKYDMNSATPNINIYSSNPGSNIALVGTDWATLGSIPFCNTPIAYADWNIGVYNDFILNAAGLAAISKTGISKFGIRNANYDVVAVEPNNIVGSKISLLRCWTADKGIAYAPKLVVTYLSPPPPINKAYALARERL
ncbi:hypothetical protein ES703_122104 [subsurface metagenome]